MVAFVSLIIASALDSALWWQFGAVVVILALTQLFVNRIHKSATKSNETAEIQELISYSEDQPSKIQKLSGLIAVFWPALVLIIAIISSVISFNRGEQISYCLTVFSAVLLLTQAQAVSKTAPLAISFALRAAASYGILILNRSKFEASAKARLVLFLKTGILTESTEVVNSIHLAVNSTLKDEHKLLALAASVESTSEHFYAVAILKAANKAELKVSKAKQIRVILGYGVEGIVSGQEVLVGSTSLLIHRNIRMEVQDLIYADEQTSKGYSIVCVVVNGMLEGILRFRDTVSPSAANAVYNVARERVRVGLITGDSAGTARSVAEQVNISEYYSELDPQRKAAFIQAEQTKGSKVAVIGDLYSDALALNQADMSIAFGSIDNVSSANCDVLVLGGQTEPASKVISLSLNLLKKTRLGLIFALSYGVLSLGLFVAIESPLQVVSLPVLATLLGSCSMVFVTLNAYSLRKLK